MAAGRLLRLAVVAQAGTMWPSGVLFQEISDRSTVELLISHYRVCSVCTTVMTKAFSLKNIAEHAKIYLQGKEAFLCAEAERVQINLPSVYNFQKTLGRQENDRSTSY